MNDPKRLEGMLKQVEDNFGSLDEWMRKLEQWYPDIPDSIEDILDDHKRFPSQRESPTGNTFMPWNVEWKEIIGDPEFSDECWQAIILKEYAFPDSYKKHPDILKAIETSFEIQREILLSDHYRDRIWEVRALPIMQQAREALELSSALRFHLDIEKQWHLTVDRFMQVIGIWVPRRLKQIVYSIEEAKHQERITEEIWNPISRIRWEIRDKIFQWKI